MSSIQGSVAWARGRARGWSPGNGVDPCSGGLNLMNMGAPMGPSGPCFPSKLVGINGLPNGLGYPQGIMGANGLPNGPGYPQGMMCANGFPIGLGYPQGMIGANGLPSGLGYMQGLVGANGLSNGLVYPKTLVEGNGQAYPQGLVGAYGLPNDQGYPGGQVGTSRFPNGRRYPRGQGRMFASRPACPSVSGDYKQCEDKRLLVEVGERRAEGMENWKPIEKRPSEQQHGEPGVSGISPRVENMKSGGVFPMATTTGVKEVTDILQKVTLGGPDEPDESGGVMSPPQGRRNPRADEVHTKLSRATRKKGTSGREVLLTANYYKLETHTDWRLYQYRVDFDPDEDRTHVRKSLLRQHKDTLGGYLFDGTMLFSSHRLSYDPLVPLEIETKRQADEEKLVITIREVGGLAPGDHHYLQFFNILLRKCLSCLDLQLVGRNFFDPRAKVEVKEYKLEIWPGYVTSIRQHEDSILMCAEISHKVMRQDTVYDLLEDCIVNGEDDFQVESQMNKLFQLMSQISTFLFQRLFKQAIIGAVVLTDYNNRTYVIDDVDFGANPLSKFKLLKGDEITYCQYYLEKYQIVIQYHSQPLLISRTRPRERRSGQPSVVYLVPELCRMTGLTDEMRANFNLMRALAEHTRVSPEKRVEKLNKFARRLLHQPQIVEELNQWNMKLSKSLVSFKGRILPNEKIIQGARECYISAQPADWTRELRGRSMLAIPCLVRWAVVAPCKLVRQAEEFVNSLRRASIGFKFEVPQPRFEELLDDRAATYAEGLDAIIHKHNPEIILCVVTNNRADRYASIKKKCYVERAVPTQVILARNLTCKGVMSIASKVAIQMACKLGGAPWTVDIPLAGLMVVGFDVCHDASSIGKSFGAMVASLDKPLSRYFSSVSHHTTREELSNGLAFNLCRAIRKYMEYNDGKMPERIIMYRDGVGEGQIPFVRDHEVTLLESKLKEMYDNAGNELKFTFVLVTKRVNTRLFVDGRNPPPGSVADSCVTLPERYDFFLVSQSVRQGTVSPTSYNVIYDTLCLKPDNLQRLTYKLTHLYYNWSGTVRVPAPCQFAHKLAYLVGQALHRPPKSLLEDTLYYL